MLRVERLTSRRAWMSYRVRLVEGLEIGATKEGASGAGLGLKGEKALNDNGLMVNKPYLHQACYSVAMVGGMDQVATWG